MNVRSLSHIGFHLPTVPHGLLLIGAALVAWVIVFLAYLVGVAVVISIGGAS